MRQRWSYFAAVLSYLGLLFWVTALLLLVPLGVCLVGMWLGRPEVSPWAWGGPALLSVLAGRLLRSRSGAPALDDRRSMMLCALAWVLVSAVGALPFTLGISMPYLDAYFETVSGFTTTGITMLEGLDSLPDSVLFWRSFIQWLGGLGILTFFLAILYGGPSAHRLFAAESHKVFGSRPTPGLVGTLRILWTIYTGLTLIVTLALVLQGMSVFDSLSHAMTALSTGGYSPHDASIGYYEAAGFEHYALMEYTLVFGMFVGGMNFLIHYRVLRGELRALWDNLEMRLLWAITAGATLLVLIDHLGVAPGHATDPKLLHDSFRASLFQVVSILTTTGFGTRDIGSAYFSGAARQVFLVLMVIGGCVGSTGGGIKVLRVGVLLKMLSRQVKRLVHGPAAVLPVVVDGEIVPAEELRRASALFFAWMLLLTVGSLITALLSGHGALESASGMFSALGNIGPCFISVADGIALHPVIKVVYILGMLAGRLEILPLLLLFRRASWR